MAEEVLEVIKSRRSVRRWKTDPVDQEIIDKILDAGYSAPSSHNSKPTQFIVVNDPATIVKLLSDRLQQKEYPYFINSKKWAKRSGLDKYEAVKPPPVLIAVCGDLNKCEDLSSLLINVSLSAQNILIAAHALGLGACWLYVFEENDHSTEDHIKEILDLSENMRVLNLIALGYPDESMK